MTGSIDYYKFKLRELLSYSFDKYSQFCWHLFEYIIHCPFQFHEELFAFAMENFNLVERAYENVLKGKEISNERFEVIALEISEKVIGKLSQVDRTTDAITAAKVLWPYFRDFHGSDLEVKSVALSVLFNESPLVPWVKLPKVEDSISEEDLKNFIKENPELSNQLISILTDKYSDTGIRSMQFAKLISEQKTIKQKGMLVHILISEILNIHTTQFLASSLGAINSGSSFLESIMGGFPPGIYTEPNQENCMECEKKEICPLSKAKIFKMEDLSKEPYSC